MPYQGIPEVVVTTNPAAGVDITYTMPDDALIRSIVWSLVTSATVNARRPTITAADSTGKIYFRAFSTASQAASLTVGYGAAEGGDMNSNSLSLLALPDGGLTCRKGDVLTISCTLKDSGDDFSAATIQFQQF